MMYTIGSVWRLWFILKVVCEQWSVVWFALENRNHNFSFAVEEESVCI